MNRNEKNTEKIKMFANSLVQKCADNGIKAVAVVSSELDCGYLSSLMEKVKAFLVEKGEKLTLISFDESSINDLSELEKALESGENGLVAASFPLSGIMRTPLSPQKKSAPCALWNGKNIPSIKSLRSFWLRLKAAALKFSARRL